MNKTLQSLIYNSIEKYYYKELAEHFLRLYTLFQIQYSHTTQLMDTVSTIEQIKQMNLFWNFRLAAFPNSIEVREWLQNHDNFITYINDFENSWMTNAIELGALNE